jgi:flagellar basal body-associated protein FliL
MTNATLGQEKKDNNTLLIILLCTLIPAAFIIVAAGVIYYMRVVRPRSANKANFDEEFIDDGIQLRTQPSASATPNQQQQYGTMIDDADEQ